MSSNAAEWDVRHREGAHKPPAEPASIVLEWLPLFPEGPALDLACGTGRHSLLLAARGQSVVAVDYSAAAIEILENRARKAKIAVTRGDPGEFTKLRPSRIHLLEADLEHLELPEDSFALILCVQYLQRSLFAHIARALQAGGILLVETFTRAQLNYSGGPRNPEYLLKPGELRSAFPGLHMLFYRELNAGQGIASLVAQKPGKRR